MNRKRFKLFSVIFLVIVVGGNFILWLIDPSKTVYCYSPSLLFDQHFLYKHYSKTLDWIGVIFVLLEVLCLRYKHPEKIPKAITVICCIIHAVNLIAVLAGLRYTPINGEGWSPIIAVLNDLAFILAIIANSKFIHQRDS